MLTLGSLSFAAPAALLALLALPALWWLLRLSPPPARRIVFPPLPFLLRLANREESARLTPPWLLALRLAIVTALILGAARPLLNAGQGLSGTGPLYLVIDDGWPSGPLWPRLQERAVSLLEVAGRENRPVVLLPTAPEANVSRPTIHTTTAASARETLKTWMPKPWSTDRQSAVHTLIEHVAAAGWAPGEVAWLSDGVEEPDAAAAAGPLANALSRLGRVTLHRPAASDLALVLAPAPPVDESWHFIVTRPEAAGERTILVQFLAEDGTPVASQSVDLQDDATRGELRVDLPAELRDRVSRVDLRGERSASAVLLEDGRWRRHPVGLVTDTPTAGRPFLGSLFYVDRALGPFAEIRRGTVDELLSRPLSAMVLADTGRLDSTTQDAVRRWVMDGGTLIRFAGPRMVRETTLEDPLLPVPLRPGERSLGGAISWGDHGRLAPFAETSPFFGLAIPDDLSIRRQVMAEPSLEVADRTWARLQDGTPLITGRREGKGWIVLVHTTANAEWSDLPLSGLFVAMMQRLIGLGRGITGQVGQVGGTPLPPIVTLDGFGAATPPPASVRPLQPGEKIAIGPHHPPGVYGNASERVALNLGGTIPLPAAIGSLPGSVGELSYGPASERRLAPWLWGAALLLLLADLLASLWMRGFLRPSQLPRASAVAILIGCVLGGWAVPTEAVDSLSGRPITVTDGSAIDASLSTRLAYVATGDPRIDRISEAGLAGLSAVANRRTAVELGPPVGVVPGRDELAFYPLLYWPVTDPTVGTALGPRAVRDLSTYMRSGGMIVFDTRGQGAADPAALRALAEMLDVPPLVPVPADHVLRRSYYLLADLPGRLGGGAVWIEPGGETVNDGVSPVIAGNADWAGAWAVDAAGRPMLPVVPGGEVQREHAYRFGINLVMYALTGNYKADQVHLPSILERLSQ